MPEESPSLARRCRIAQRALGIAAFVCLLVACMLSLSACFGMPQPPKVAATVNGEIIEEDEVTDFIEAFRKKNAQYETDTGWADFLISNGYTSDSLRTYVLNNVFIPKVLIKQQCADRGIQVDDTDLDEVIEKEKQYYEERYGENSWDSVLASYGYDEKTWRENELNRLLEEELSNVVIGKVTPTQQEIQAQADLEAASYNGKDSYYIAFESEEDAQSAYDRLTDAHETVTLDQFRRFGKLEHAGWNSLPSTRDDTSDEYIQAANELEEHHVSEPVYADETWMLIFCDRVFNVDTSGKTVVLSTIPKEIYDQLVIDASQVKADALLNEWLVKLAQESDIEIEPMPSGLPYNVSTTYVEQ